MGTFSALKNSFFVVCVTAAFLSVVMPSQATTPDPDASVDTTSVDTTYVFDPLGAEGVLDANNQINAYNPASGLTEEQWNEAATAQQLAVEEVEARAAEMMQEYNQISNTATTGSAYENVQFAAMLGTESKFVPQQPCSVPNGYVSGQDNQNHYHCSYYRTGGYGTNSSTVTYLGVGASCSFYVSCVGHRPNHSCFAPDSKILMSDKTTKPVQLLQEGDSVWNPVLKKAARIVRVLAGPEPTALIEVGFEGGILHATYNHPMITRQTAASAEEATLVNASLSSRPENTSKGSFRVQKLSELQVGDEILTADGSYKRITSYKKLSIEKKQLVYNIVLEGTTSNPDEHVLVANGIVTGDFAIQQVVNKTLAN